MVTLVQGDSRFLSSKAIFTGVDHSDRDAEYDKMFEDPRNHVTATSSILDVISQRTEFRPKEDGFTEDNEQFLSFKDETLGFESFIRKEGTTHVLKLTGGRNRLKEQIATVYVPLAGGMKADVAAAAFVEQIPESTKKTFSGTWTLVLMTIHGGDDNKVSVDLSSMELKISVNDNGLVTVPDQEVTIAQGPFQVSAEVLERESTFYSSYYPRVDVKTLLDTLTTPKSKSSDHFLDAWFSEPDHSCETKFQSSKYAHRQSLYRMSQLRMDW
jgi:hypothetical protein